MINKQDFRLGATVVVAVMVAGFLMAQFSGNSMVEQSRSGFGG